MAFFKKLFDKKECDLCGSEIGLLGNRKLEDGNCCKDCAAKLSPWFEDRKESTVAQIRQQLEYRLSNAQALQDFQPSKSYGDSHRMFVEEKDGVPFRFCVSGKEDYLEDNADLVLFEDVEEVIIDIDDNAREIQNEEDSEDITYDLSYTFRVSLLIKNNPYFDNIHFELNQEPVELFGVSVRYEDCESEADLMLYEEVYPAFVANYRRYKTMCQEIEAMVNGKS